MVFKFSKNARYETLSQYKEWKKEHLDLIIVKAVNQLYNSIKIEGLYVSSDIQLAIWVAKDYTAYRTKDSKWYFGGYTNNDNTIFTAQDCCYIAWYSI